MSILSRRGLIVAAALLPLQARAQTWPAGPIRLIVPFAAGGSVDAIARLLQPGLQQRLGSTVIVEDRPGASGTIGTDLVAKSRPDGGTWLFTFDNHVLNPYVLPRLPFDTEKDLDPVYLLGKAPYVMCTETQKPYRTIADVIAAAKAQRGRINYGTPGTGSLGHLATVLLAREAGIELVHVPYRGAGPALNDALAGHLELFVGSVAVAMPQIEAGTVRPILQFGETRAAALPAVPTARESGFPKLVAEAWWGFFAPAGTPAGLSERFAGAVDAVLRDEAVAQQLTGSQQVTLVYGDAAELRRFVRGQMDLWGPVAGENGIKVE